MRILLPLSPGSSTPRRLQLTYSSPLHSALSFPSLASYTTARSPAFSRQQLRVLVNQPVVSLRRRIDLQLERVYTQILSLGNVPQFLFPFHSPSVPLAHWPAVNYPASFSQHLFFRGARDWLKRMASPPLAPVIGYRTMFNSMTVNFLRPPNRGVALNKAFFK